MHTSLTTSTRNNRNNRNSQTNSHTSHTSTNRRRGIATAAALVSLALAASACGGATPVDSAGVDAALVDLTAEAAPIDVTPAPTILGGGQAPDAATADPATGAADPTNVNPPTNQQPGERTPDTPNPDSDNNNNNNNNNGGDQGNGIPDPGTSNPPGEAGEQPPNQNPDSAPQVDFGTVSVFAPELFVAQACYANSQTLTWTAGGINDMVVDDRLGNLVSSSAARSPLSTVRHDSGGPLLQDGISTRIDENLGFGLAWKVNGQIGDIAVRWESSTTEAGNHASPAFHSQSNPLCFVKAGFSVAIQDAPPIGPNRPELSDPLNQPDEAKLPDNVQPQADMEVAVRNVKIEATPECFAGGLSSRFFHTTHSPVAVVLDTNGISETLSTTMEHDDLELTDQLRELSISDGALRAFANRDEGYAVTVQVQGAVSGGIVFEWAETATAPGTYTSPTFSGPTDDCDISINFLVLELD